MKRAQKHLGRYLIVLLLGLIMALPLFYLISGSLMSYSEFVQYPPRIFPSEPVWENFVKAWEYLTPRTVGNTFIFVISVLVLQLSICLPAGFALSKIRFRWSGVLFGFFIIPMFFPHTLNLIPTYIVTLQLGIVGSFAGLILPVVGQASFGVLLFRQFFVTLPDGLIEAARIDGASWFRTFFSIAVPLARPMIASYSVITFLNAWNMFIWPLVAAPGEKTRVLTVALAPLATSEYSHISPAVGFAAAVIAMLPVLIVFIAFQRWFERGVVGTGLE